MRMMRSQLERLADAVVQIVELLFQRMPGLAWRRLGKKRIGRGGAGPEGQLLGKVVGKLDEMLVCGHGCAFAAELDHGPHFSGKIGEYADPSGSGCPAGLFFGNLGPGLAQEFYRLLNVAFGLAQGAFAIHHGQAGFFSKGLHVGRGNLCHKNISN